MNKYSKAQIVLKYIGYWLRASNGKGHGTHSPFIFNFIRNVLNDRNEYEGYKQVESLKDHLEKDHTKLKVEDFGAGAATEERSVSEIAMNAAKPGKYSRLLYRMVKNYKPAVVLEMGTSLGITTSYLAFAQPHARIITMEGAPEIAKRAEKNFDLLGLRNISLIQGNFDETLTGSLDQESSLDFVFVDGNHRMEPTLRYFHQLLPKMKNDSIIVFDDIHWSREMEESWVKIKAHPAVHCTVDLFFIGIVFFREEFREKQDFRIRF